MQKEQLPEGLSIPSAKNTECQLLAELVACPEYIPIALQQINSEMFSQPDFGNTWKLLVDMDSRGETIDLSTVYPRVGKMVGNQLLSPAFKADNATMLSVSDHCTILRDFAIRRAVFISAWRMLQQSDDTTTDINELISIPASLAEYIEKSGQIGTKTKTLPNVLNEFAEYLQEVQSRKSQGLATRVPSGFKMLDFLTYGGFDAGQLIILAARPSVGKTAIAIQMAINAGNAGIPVTIYSLEMTNRSLAQRMVVSTGCVDPKRIASGDVDWQHLEDANGRLCNLPIFLNDEDRTLESISADIIAGHHRGRCGLAIVDYLGIIQGGNPKQIQTQVIAERTARFKRLAKDCGIPIIVLSQLNRQSASEERAPQLIDLRDSGSIEQDADIVLMLERATRTLDDNLVNMWVRKNRQGQAGDILVQLKGNSSFTRFEEV